jgi:hypothetical protein
MANSLFSIGVGIVSFSTIALQLMLTRIFSVTMYYHFAFMVISLALLGIAVAGVAVYLLPRVFRPERAAVQAAVFTLLFAASSVIALSVALNTPIRLHRVSESSDDLLRVYAASALPFLMSGFAITLAIATAGPAIGRIYAFDLFGAALGCLAVVPLLSYLGAPGAIVAVAGFAAAGAACFAASGRPVQMHRKLSATLVVAGGMAALVLLGVGLTEPWARRFEVARNADKFLGDRDVLFEKWNALSQITVARGEADHNWIFIDGDAATRMWSGELAAKGYAATRRVPEVRVASLAYALRNNGTALVIGPGGGADVVSALHYGVRRVIGVEINPTIIDDVMRGRFAEYTGNLYRDPRVQIVVDEGRSFIRRAQQRFATIQATLVDTWAASSSGAFTLSENNLYTREAFVEFLGRLEDDGILTVTRWYAPELPMEFVRLVALGRSALEEMGVSPSAVSRHFIIATDGHRRTTMLLGRRPFTEEDIRAVGEVAKRDRLRILFSPTPTSGVGSANERNGLAEDPIVAAAVRAPDLATYLATLDYDARPPTDNRPFFFYTLFPEQLFGLLEQPESVALSNLGALILLMLLGLSLLATFAFVVLPLFAFRASAIRKEPILKLRVLGYFICIGLAFILVEIGMMQHFVLFLGHPIYSLVVVLASLLAASGAGSALSAAAESRVGGRAFIWVAAGALGAVLLVYATALTPLFHALLGLPLAVRIVIAALLVSLPGLLMGMLLPSGVRAASALATDLVPWAWGLNGASSVLGSILAIFVSMHLGFTVALSLGLSIYLLTPALLPRVRVRQAPGAGEESVIRAPAARVTP